MSATVISNAATYEIKDAHVWLVKDGLLSVYDARSTVIAQFAIWEAVFKS